MGPAYCVMSGGWLMNEVKDDHLLGMRAIDRRMRRRSRHVLADSAVVPLGGLCGLTAVLSADQGVAAELMVERSAPGPCSTEPYSLWPVGHCKWTVFVHMCTIQVLDRLSGRYFGG